MAGGALAERFEIPENARLVLRVVSDRYCRIRANGAPLVATIDAACRVTGDAPALFDRSTTSLEEATHP